MNRQNQHSQAGVNGYVVSIHLAIHLCTHFCVCSFTLPPVHPPTYQPAIYPLGFPPITLLPSICSSVHPSMDPFVNTRAHIHPCIDPPAHSHPHLESIYSSIHLSESPCVHPSIHLAPIFMYSASIHPSTLIYPPMHPPPLTSPLSTEHPHPLLPHKYILNIFGEGTSWIWSPKKPFQLSPFTGSGNHSKPQIQDHHLSTQGCVTQFLSWTLTLDIWCGWACWGIFLFSTRPHGRAAPSLRETRERGLISACAPSSFSKGRGGTAWRLIGPWGRRRLLPQAAGRTGTHQSNLIRAR